MTRTTKAAGVLLAVALAAGCGSYPKDAKAQVRTACERQVKRKLKQRPVKFSRERVTIGSVRTRASVEGYAARSGSAPQWFMCAVEKTHGAWNLVTLAGV